MNRNLIIFGVAFGLISAATSIMATTTTSSPCLEQNGCQCNTSLVSVVKGKPYGTCTSCYPLFDGPTCGSRLALCLNDGQEIWHGDGTTECHCLPQYYGERCEHRQCINSVGGTGPERVLASNSSGMCDDCSPDNWGITCSMCKNDKGCSSFGAGSRCLNQSPVANGTRKSFQCKIPGYFQKLLGGVDGSVVVDCQKPGGFRDTTIANGTCAATVYRTENHYALLDPFFTCSMFNCSMDVQTVETIAPNQGFSNHTDGIWWIGTTLCLSLSGVLVLNGWTKSGRGKRNILVVVFIMLFASITVFVAAAAASMHYNSPNRKKVHETVVDYNCKYTNCSCSPDVAKPYSSCAPSPFGKGYISILTGPTQFRCLLNATNCTLSLGNFPIKSTCEPSECLPPPNTTGSGVSSLPGGDDGDPGSHQQDSLIHAGATIILGCIGALCALGLVMHYYLSKRASAASNVEFVRRFGDVNQSNSSAATLPQGRTIPADPRTEGPSVLASAATATPRKKVAIVDGEHSNSEELATPRINAPTLSLNSRDDEFDDDDIAEESSCLVHSPQLHSPTDGAAHSAYVLTTDSSGGMLSTGQQGMGASEEQEEDEALRGQPRESVLSISRLNYYVDADDDDKTITRTSAKKGKPSGEEQEAETNTEISTSRYKVGPKGKKVILKEVSFSVASGEMLALMGPSGAGKTSLLDIMSMRKKVGLVEGSIFLDDYEITGRVTAGSSGESSAALPQTKKTLSVRHFKSLVGYVSQEDTLLASLTVYQAVCFAACFKLPSVLSKQTIHDLVIDVLHTLKLSHCVHSVIGDEKKRGLSGGEKRRVSIAMELVGKPKILFLDEPTSGLDSNSATHVMEAIASVLKQHNAPGGGSTSTGNRINSPALSASSRRVAQCPYFNFKPIVVFSIHQPSMETFRLFDKILLLAKGSVIGFGPAATAVASLIQISGYTGTPTVANPADFLLRVEDQLSRVERGRLLEHAQSYEVQPCASPHLSRSSQRAPLMITSRFYLNGWQKLGLLTKRTWMSLLGSYYLIVCHYLVTILLSIFMSALYSKEPLDLAGALNRAGSMSFLLLVVGFVSISSTETFLGERRVFLHEREGGFYTSMPYYMPKLLFDAISLRITPIIVLGTIIYFSMGFRTDDSTYFLWYLLILTVFSVTVTAMIICIAMVSPSFGVAALFSSIVLLWQFVFGGLMVQSDTIPSYLKWTSKASPFFLAFEPLLVNELNGQHCTFAPRGSDGSPTDTNIPIMCVQYLANLGLTPNNFAMDVTLLACWCLFYTGLGWFLLAFVVKQRK